MKALDLTDVVISKLYRFHGPDREDIRAMVLSDTVRHPRLLSRFLNAVDAFRLDARAEDRLPGIIKHFQVVERDYFGLPPTPTSNFPMIED